MEKFDMNADPVAFWQFLQWQIRRAMGSPIISYLIDLHKQDPDRIVEEEDIAYVVRTWRETSHGKSRQYWPNEDVSSARTQRHGCLTPRGGGRKNPKHDVGSMGTQISARGPVDDFLYWAHPIRPYDKVYVLLVILICLIYW